jgi:hypothetical protein
MLVLFRLPFSHASRRYAAFCGPFMLNAIWKLALDLISFLQPLAAPLSFHCHRPHRAHSYFFCAILKELNTTKEKFELGKSVFYIFTLFLVQLLQNIFLGRYQYAFRRVLSSMPRTVHSLTFL